MVDSCGGSIPSCTIGVLMSDSWLRRRWVWAVVVVLVSVAAFLVWFVNGPLDTTRAPGSPEAAAMCALDSLRSQSASDDQLSRVRHCLTDEAADRLIEVRRQLVASGLMLEIGPVETVESSADRATVTIA